VLDDPAGVSDRLAVDVEHREAGLAGEVRDGRAVGASEADVLGVDAVAAQLARDPAARAQPVRRGPAAVQDRGRHGGASVDPSIGASG